MQRAPAARGLLTLYDDALPTVYGYLITRCGDRSVAEDLTAETFLAAVDAVRREPPTEVTAGWLIGVARHKLVDHWRRRGRDERLLHAVAADPTQHRVVEDPWEARLDAAHVRSVLAHLGAHHRGALTLRYLDGLGVPEVASILGRSVHATEALLVRARAAFRQAHALEDGDD